MFGPYLPTLHCVLPCLMAILHVFTGVLRQFYVQIGHCGRFCTTCAKDLRPPASPADAGVVGDVHRRPYRSFATIRPEYWGVSDRCCRFIPFWHPDPASQILNFHSEWAKSYHPCEGFADPRKQSIMAISCTESDRFGPKSDPFLTLLRGLASLSRSVKSPS